MEIIILPLLKKDFFSISLTVNAKVLIEPFAGPVERESLVCVVAHWVTGNISHYTTPSSSFLPTATLHTPSYLKINYHN